MNKSTYFSKYILFAMVILLSQACYIDLDDDGFGCERGKGSIVTESRALPDYYRITNAIGADMVIRQDQRKEFRVTGPENLLDDITTSVIDGELVIDYRGCYRDASIEIFLANPEIEAVYNIGSGDIIGDNIWSTPTLDLRISGSGRVDAEFNTDRLNAEITGSGIMELFGTTNQGDLRISGSGDIYAFNLESNVQNINITGSGNCEVLTFDVLDVRISGSGNVYYKGRPQVNSIISGSGSVLEAN